MSATTWRKQAACRGLDVEAFYPMSEDEADAAEAKAICTECPVRQACLEHALAHREREGVWGGTTERERRRIVRPDPFAVLAFAALVVVVVVVAGAPRVQGTGFQGSGCVLV
jgi:WhiB family redox-sensing transcriptional regulator